MSKKRFMTFVYVVTLAFDLVVSCGCQDRRRTLMEFLDDCVYVNPQTSTFMGFNTYGFNVLDFLAQMKNYFRTCDLGILAREKYCLLMLKTQEDSLHTRELMKIYKSWATKDFEYHFQSVNVAQNKGSGFPRPSYVLLFFRERDTGVWLTLGIDPCNGNGAGAGGSVGDTYMLYDRRWVCRNFDGNVPLSPSLFDGERFDDVFALCIESLDATLLYSSQSKIETLRLRSDRSVLRLGWRTSNCLIFVPQDFPFGGCHYYSPETEQVLGCPGSAVMRLIRNGNDH